MARSNKRGITCVT